jgi:hypothetical protein
MDSHAQNISPEWSSPVALGLYGSSASIQLSNMMHAMPSASLLRFLDSTQSQRGAVYCQIPLEAVF